MQNVASVLTDQFSDLLERLPAGLDLDRLALETKAIQRRREVVGGAALLRIALARGPGGLSLRQTAAWASMQGIAELSNPGVKYRLDQATEFLAVLVERLLAAKAPGAELRWPGRISCTNWHSTIRTVSRDIEADGLHNGISASCGAVKPGASGAPLRGCGA